MINGERLEIRNGSRVTIVRRHMESVVLDKAPYKTDAEGSVLVESRVTRLLKAREIVPNVPSRQRRQELISTRLSQVQ